MNTLECFNKMKEYQQITHSGDKKIMGVSNGICQFEIDFNSLPKTESFTNLFLKTKVEDFLLINTTKIKDSLSSGLKAKRVERAVATDFIVFSPYLFGIKYIVNSKFVNCLDYLDVSKDQYSLLPIELEECSDKHFLLFIPWVPNYKINFNKSLIYPQYEKFNENKTYYEISNLNEFIELQNDDPFFSFEKIVINSAEIGERDLIHLQASPYTFFSKRLMDLIKAESLTNIIEVKKGIEIVFN